MTTDIPFWRLQVTNPNSPVDGGSLTKTICSVYEELNAKGVSAIDLRNLDHANVQGEQLVCVLRCTYRGRKEILGWDEAIWVAMAALKREGLDYKDVLTGLI